MSWTRQSWGAEQPRLLADLTGDRKPDILGFGTDGVWVSVNDGSGAFQPPKFVLAEFSFKNGWRVGKHPRLLADLTGDGRADIIGFGEAGVWTALNNGDGTFKPAQFVLAGFCSSQGWQVDQHPRFVADLTGDGKADLIGFGNDGVWVAFGNGDGSFQPPVFAVSNFGTNQGWRFDQHPRFVADLTGDGRADIVGFGNDGVSVALNNGNGSFQAATGALGNFGFNQGWHVDRHPRFLCDLNGDRRADIVGFGDAGVWTSTSTGSGFSAAAFVLQDLGYSEGWRVETHSRMTADLTGDGKADIIGFGDAGVWTFVTGGSGEHFVLAAFGAQQGWTVADHPRLAVDLNGDGRADLIGFGNDGVWTAMGNGDGSFQPARFMLADFGHQSGHQLAKINITFHTYEDNLDHDSQLHVFIKNRSNTSSTPGGSTSYISDLLAYQDHDANWFDKNPYLGMGQNLSGGWELSDPSTQTFSIKLRSKPIPIEEIILPVVNIHIITQGDDRWIFDYTVTFVFDDGRQFSFNSNVNGVNGLILDQDNGDYSGIGIENPFVKPPVPIKPVTDEVLTGVAIEFYTHNDNKNDDTKLNIHVVNRLSDTASQDILIATDVLAGHEFSEGGYIRIDPPIVSTPVRLADMMLPLININIGQSGSDQWIFDYRITFVFGAGTQPYSSTISGVVIDQDRHKHIGVYNGRPFPTLHYPKATLTPFAIDHVFHPKQILLGYVQKKLDLFINNRQGIGNQLPPLMKIRLDNTGTFIDSALPETYADVQSLHPNPPPPDGTPQGPEQFSYRHSAMNLGQFQKLWALIGFYFQDVNSKLLTLKLSSGNTKTPFTLDLQFETDGPTEIIGSDDMDIVFFEIQIHLSLAFDEANQRVDLMSWVDDINGMVTTNIGNNLWHVTGSFLGSPIDVKVASPDNFRTNLIGQVVHVDLRTSSAWDLGGAVQKEMREELFSKLSKPDSLTKISMRDSLNATINSWLMGGVITKGNAELVPYPNPNRLVTTQLKDDILTLNYIGPEKSFVYKQPVPWPGAVDFSPGTLANIDHIVVLMQENRSFDHMLGYLSLPPAKGGMGRTDIDGLKGGEFNMFNGTRADSFPFVGGDTIFSPGPSNSTEKITESINGGRMDGFAQAQFDECGPDTARRVMGYHTAANVPTYDSLARDFAVGQRWFESHPGPTFPNRYYSLTGRPNIDPWGVWEYANSNPMGAVFTDTIFEHLTAHGVSWRQFEHGYSFLRFFERHTFDSQNLVEFDDRVLGFEALAKSGNLPSVSFIDPHYVDLPPDGACDEAPSDIKNSQAFIKRLVETVVSSPKWNKTLLLITYDEHGGFYDHVPPATVAKVSDELFGTTGARVPAFVVSPWVKGGSVFGSDAMTRGGASLHFEHTSILKTIARRFMSSSPPYMGARYAAAHDLSEVLGNELRAGPFLPFIPYTLNYLTSKMCLDVPGASTSAGAALTQVTPNKTAEQDFRFEDAGGGFFYIRTVAGLYLTVDVQVGPNTGAAPTTSFAVKQDLKYPPGPLITRNPDLQRWKLSSSAILATQRDTFTIACAALPQKVLQSQAGSLVSGAAVVVGDPTPVKTAMALHNPWRVGSVLAPLADPVNTQ